MTLAVEHHSRLVDKLVKESGEAVAQLVGTFFNRAASKGLRSPASFDITFSITARILDGNAIDRPKPFSLISSVSLDEQTCAPYPEQSPKHGIANLWQALSTKSA